MEFMRHVQYPAERRKTVKFIDDSLTDRNLFKLKSMYQCRCCGRTHVELIAVNEPGVIWTTGDVIEGVE